MLRSDVKEHERRYRATRARLAAEKDVFIVLAPPATSSEAPAAAAPAASSSQPPPGTDAAEATSSAAAPGAAASSSQPPALGAGPAVSSELPAAGAAAEATTTAAKGGAGYAKVVNAVLQTCVLPRALMSLEDALYCHQFGWALYELNTPGWSSITYWDRVSEDGGVGDARGRGGREAGC